MAEQVRWRGQKPRKKSQAQVESDAELVGSGTGGWRQEVSSTLVGIWELLRYGYLKRIAQSLDGGLEPVKWMRMGILL